MQQYLYWPDGRRKKRSKSHVIEQSHNRMCLLAQALVDKYNENHNLLGVCSLSLPPSFFCPPTRVALYLFAHVRIADLSYASSFRILHMSSKTLCSINQFVRTVCGTIISISLQGLKKLMVSHMASTICSSRRSNVCDRDNMKNWWSAVSACSNRLITVFYIYSYLKLRIA